MGCSHEGRERREKMELFLTHLKSRMNIHLKPLDIPRCEC